MTQQAPQPGLRCPVCEARFRGTSICSRCGTDLTPILRIAARAYIAREAAREALRGGDLWTALRRMAQARRLHQAGDW